MHGTGHPDDGGAGWRFDCEHLILWGTQVLLQRPLWSRKGRCEFWCRRKHLCLLSLLSSFQPLFSHFLFHLFFLSFSYSSSSSFFLVLFFLSSFFNIKSFITITTTSLSSHHHFNLTTIITTPPSLLSP